MQCHQYCTHNRYFANTLGPVRIVCSLSDVSGSCDSIDLIDSRCYYDNGMHWVTLLSSLEGVVVLHCQQILCH